MPTADIGGIEYRLRRSLADRLVLAAKLLLIWGGGGARGRLTRNVGSFNRGRGTTDPALLAEPFVWTKTPEQILAKAVKQQPTSGTLH